MTFWHHLKAAWLYAITMPVYREEADHEDAWTLSDRKEYTAFMESPTGQKLRIRQRNLIYKSAVSAMHSPADLPYKCGRAAGITATFSWLDGHLLSLPHQEPETELSAEPFEEFRT